MSRLGCRLIPVALVLCHIFWKGHSAPGPASAPAAQAPLPARPPFPTLTLFADPLTIPPIVSAGPSGAINITAFKTMQKFHRDLPPSSVYAFGASKETAASPGPTVLAYRGQRLRVTWGNNITDTAHMFAVDYTINAPRPPRGGVPINVHLHGAMVSSSYDGHPLSWFTSQGDVGPTFVSYEYEYPNVQPGSTLWYHDHTLGMTRLNLAAGLLGLYIVRDEALERTLGLPQGAYDVPLVLQDKSFNLTTGELFYPSEGCVPEVHPHWVPEFFGDFILVNGKVSPYLEVEPQLYRFRLLNGANARFFTLQFNLSGIPVPFSVVATDAFFLESPVNMSQLTMGPAERVEILVDFSAVPFGAKIVLRNSATVPYKSGDPPASENQRSVMMFSVSKSSGTGISVSAQSKASIPDALVNITKLEPASAVMRRQITMTERTDVKRDEPLMGMLEGHSWMDPVTVRPQLGTTEVWEVINLSEDWHPFHIHFAPHQLVQRQPIDSEGYLAGNCTLNGTSGMPSCFTGPAVAASGAEIAWKDTTQAPAGYVTTLVIRFGGSGELPFDPTAGPGYGYHCHILEHEDNNMMRPMVLVEGSSGSAPPNSGTLRQHNLGAWMVVLLLAVFSLAIFL